MLELLFDLESDRIRDLAFDPQIIESEHRVVYWERRSSVDNTNPGTLFEQLWAGAFIAHPYHWPGVGWPGPYRQLKTGVGIANLLGSYEVFYGSYQRLYDEARMIEARSYSNRGSPASFRSTHTQRLKRPPAPSSLRSISSSACT